MCVYLLILSDILKTRLLFLKTKARYLKKTCKKYFNFRLWMFPLVSYVVRIAVKLF